MGGGETGTERVWWEALNESGNTSGWVVGLGGIGGDDRNRQWKRAGTNGMGPGKERAECTWRKW